MLYDIMAIKDTYKHYSSAIPYQSYVNVEWHHGYKGHIQVIFPYEILVYFNIILGEKLRKHIVCEKLIFCIILFGIVLLITYIV